MEKRNEFIPLPNIPLPLRFRSVDTIVSLYHRHRSFPLCFAQRFCLIPPMKSRQAAIKRATKETRISLKLNIDGRGKSSIKTGIPFFDHMLTLFAKHAVMDLTLRCDG